MHPTEQEKIISASGKLKKIDFVKEVVCAYYHHPITDYNKKNRKLEIIKLKYVTYWLILEATEVNKSEVSRAFGCHHATVHHGYNQINNYLSFDRELQHEIKDLKAIITNKLTFVDGKLNLDDDYHYINLDDCISVKTVGKKAIVFTGYTKDDIKAILFAAGEDHRAPVEFNGTGMYLIKKSKEQDGGDKTKTTKD